MIITHLQETRALYAMLRAGGYCYTAAVGALTETRVLSNA